LAAWDDFFTPLIPFYSQTYQIVVVLFQSKLLIVLLIGAVILQRLAALALFNPALLFNQ
jgi:hypothetical protein